MPTLDALQHTRTCIGAARFAKLFVDVVDSFDRVHEGGRHAPFASRLLLMFAPFEEELRATQPSVYEYDAFAAAFDRLLAGIHYNVAFVLGAWRQVAFSAHDGLFALQPVEASIRRGLKRVRREFDKNVCCAVADGGMQAPKLQAVACRFAEAQVALPKAMRQWVPVPGSTASVFLDAHAQETRHLALLKAIHVGSNPDLAAVLTGPLAAFRHHGGVGRPGNPGRDHELGDYPTLIVQFIGHGG